MDGRVALGHNHQPGSYHNFRHELSHAGAGAGTGGGGGVFFNASLVRQTNGSTFGLGWSGTAFVNLGTGTYDLEGDNDNIANDNMGCCSPPYFNNYGLIRKSSGAGTSVIGAVPGYIGLTFDNLGGTIEVDDGTLVLNGGGGSSNATVNVSAGALLDLTGGSSMTWAGQMEAARRRGPGAVEQRTFVSASLRA